MAVVSRPVYLASPLLAFAGWLAAGFGVAAWIWRRAPLIDDAHTIEE